MKQLLVALSLFMCIAGKQQTDKTKKSSKDCVYSSVEQMPEPGFDMVAFLAQNLTYPASITAENVQGKLIIRFIVNEDGHTSDYIMLNKCNPEVGKSVIDVLRKMPKWQVGTQNGIAVKVYYTLPIYIKPE